MFRIGLAALALSAVAFAQQQTIPGTFTTVPAGPEVGTTLPLVSTPTLTLSNGFEPATVTIPSTLVNEPGAVAASAMPQAEESGGYLWGSPFVYGTPYLYGNTPYNYGTMSSEAAPGNVNTTIVSSNDLSMTFDLALVNPNSAYNWGYRGPTLGELAKRAVANQKPAVKTFTNADVERIDTNEPQNGVISANYANGQPIIANKNIGPFNPPSGIANMPYANTGEDNDQMANGEQENPGQQGNATASNADQGQPVNASPTTPSTAQNQNAQPAQNGNQQQMPASDQPH